MSVTVAETAERPDDSQARSSVDWTFHGVLLGAAVAVVLLSMVLNVRDSRQVLIPFTKMPLPDLCTFRRMTGLDCPGCGLTRSFISLGHGDIARAWSYNPAGLPLYAVVLFQIPFRLVQLGRVKHGKRELHLGGIGGTVMAAATALVLCQWVLKQIGLGF